MPSQIFQFSKLKRGVLLQKWLGSQNFSSSNCLANLKEDFLDLKGI